MKTKKEHWEKVFETKAETEVSWYQPNPSSSLEFFVSNNIPKDARIIEVGGGDSYVVDHLLELGYLNITLLDISAKAIERIKARLGDKANDVVFIVIDVLDFKPEQQFDVWHDRASFHFLTSEDDIEKYREITSNSVVQNGYLFLGTFSVNGPEKCSGLPITQYSDAQFKAVFSPNFELLNSFTIDHETPFDTVQNFIFCTLKKI